MPGPALLPPCVTPGKCLPLSGPHGSHSYDEGTGPSGGELADISSYWVGWLYLETMILPAEYMTLFQEVKFSDCLNC